MLMLTLYSITLAALLEFVVAWPLSETLKFIEPYFSGQLISPQVFSQVKAITNFLPDAMFSFYLECRLAANTTQVDFLISAISKDAREILAGYNTKADISDTLLQDPLWSHVRDFFGYWAKSTSPLYEQVPIIWLEFDQIDQSLPIVPLPCVMFCVNPQYLERRGQLLPSNRINPQKCQLVTEVACEILIGHPLSSEIKQNLFACFELLPAGGQIIHVSAMLPRQPAALKIYVSIPKERLLEYLTQIGWIGSVGEVKSILTEFCTAKDDIRVDLTIGPMITPNIGIVFSEVQVNGLRRSGLGPQNLLDQCVENGLCTPEKREALLTWPGSSRELYSHEGWPTRLSRWLDIKIVYQPNRPLEAKGYLGFMPHFSLF
jgi:hypothetical protein